MKKEDQDSLKFRLISDQAEIRKKALAEVKRMDIDQAMNLLVSGLESKNDDVQSDLVRTIISFKETALPYLVNGFTNPSWNIRNSVSKVIASLGEEGLNQFLELLPQNEEDVDYWMVQTLGLMGGKASDYLKRAFHHQKMRLRIAAVRASGNSRDPKLVPSLLPLLEEGGAWPLRKAAFDSLVALQNLNPAPIYEALKTASPEAKYWLIKLVAERHDPNLIQTFQGIIESDPVECKLEAINALALIEAPDIRKILVGYLAHNSWIVRKTAADVIWQHGAGALDELIKGSDASNVDIRYWSVRLLGESNEPRVFEKILDRLRDSHVSVRVAACQAIGSLGDKRGLAPLMTMLSDPSEEVRTHATLAIGQIGEKDKHQKEIPSIPSHLLPENQVSCHSCGKKIGRNFTFCPFCLKHLMYACQKCGRALEVGWKGCPDCGEPAKAKETSE